MGSAKSRLALALKTAEDVIDPLLQDLAGMPGGIVVGADLLPTVPGIEKAIIERYQNDEFGWRVEYVPDKEGNFFRFS